MGERATLRQLKGPVVIRSLLVSDLYSLGVSLRQLKGPVVICSLLVSDLYSLRIMESGELGVSLRQLKASVDSEVGYMKQLMEVMGSMDILFSASSQTFVQNSDTNINKLNMSEPSMEVT